MKLNTLFIHPPTHLDEKREKKGGNGVSIIAAAFSRDSAIFSVVFVSHINFQFPEEKKEVFREQQQ